MAEEIQKDIKKGRDAGIDLIRVVACLVVIGTHVDVMGTGDSTKLFLRLLFADGVTLFFILSGFFRFYEFRLKKIQVGIFINKQK